MRSKVGKGSHGGSDAAGGVGKGEVGGGLIPVIPPPLTKSPSYCPSPLSANIAATAGDATGAALRVPEAPGVPRSCAAHPHAAGPGSVMDAVAAPVAPGVANATSGDVAVAVAAAVSVTAAGCGTGGSACTALEGPFVGASSHADLVKLEGCVS